MSILQVNTFRVNLIHITLPGDKKHINETRVNYTSVMVNTTCLAEPVYFQLLVKSSVTFGNCYFRTLASTSNQY